MENEMSRIDKISTPIGYSETTGLNIYESYTALSGFKYMVGIREMGDLLILEQIAEGTACTFLCGVLIYQNETKKLIKEIEVEKNIRYTRAKALEIVREALLDILLESVFSEGLEMNTESANRQISEMLDHCYFDQSRMTILNWARSIGII